jgi:FecR protein
MRQHLRIRNTVVTFGLGLLWAMLASGHARAQSGAANVARISFVQGSVQMMTGQGADPQQAVMNMPATDGSRLQTGGDGQVEIEFGDGSVARLTPNSSIQFDHLGQDQVQLEQPAGLAYYEFNVGEGHPPFTVQAGGASLQPTGNAIVRVGLDAGWEVAVLSGGANVQGVDVAENQSIHASNDNSGNPYAVSQGINSDSWDNWNQDRDQAIAQEASQQTPVRDQAANSQSENWNDLDADGNWYPVEGSSNVWVPAGVDANWDPYGAGYWAYYPTFGYTWVSAYPWGWLPYHCGAWSYYSFGWGWAPGGCGARWSPVIVVANHPPGWVMPVRPVRPPVGIYPVASARLVFVNRGPVATGPWGVHGSFVPRPDHLQAININGRMVTPLTRVDVRAQGFAAAKGTAPGTRAVLSGAPRGYAPRPAGSNSFAQGGYRPSVPAAPSTPGAQGRPNVGYVPSQSYNQQRSTYVARPTPSAHYSAPPPPPPPAHSGGVPAGGGSHR